MHPNEITPRRARLLKCGEIPSGRGLLISRSRPGGAEVIRGGTTGMYPKARASWRVSLPSRMPGPSTGTGPGIGPLETGQQTYALPARRGPGPGRARTLWRFEHPRQPYESWWSNRRLPMDWSVVPSGWTLTMVLNRFWARWCSRSSDGRYALKRGGKTLLGSS